MVVVSAESLTKGEEETVEEGMKEAERLKKIIKRIQNYIKRIRVIRRERVQVKIKVKVKVKGIVKSLRVIKKVKARAVRASRVTK